MSSLTFVGRLLHVTTVASSTHGLLASLQTPFTLMNHPDFLSHPAFALWSS
jgi:hypothetical protein